MGYFDFPHTRTYDTDLGWIIKHISEYDDIIKTLDEWIEVNTPKIDDLITFMKDLQNENTLPEGVKEAIYNWCAHHLTDLIGATISNVFFEINDEGYFVAYVPDSWNDITFNTTYWDIVLSDHPEYGFGHLVLSY